MDTLPQFQQALKVRGAREVGLDKACPLPALEDDEILVRVRCVAINPVDAKVLDMAPNIAATPGCEFAGDIVSVGPSVKNAGLKVGAAVFGVVCGNHPKRKDNGAFAEYVAVVGDLVFLLPPHLSYQQGASLGVALATVGMAVYHLWPLPLPYNNGNGDIAALDSAEGSARLTSPIVSKPPPPAPSPVGLSTMPRPKQYILVYGGSTVCGAMALQLLRKSGLVPVTTCSPQNFALVKELGAEEAFDYHSPNCGDAIRQHTSDSIAYVLDCITNVDSMRICYAAMGRAGGKYMGLDPVPLRAHTRRDIKPDYILVYTMFGKDVDWPRPYGRSARPKDRVFAESWYRGTQTLVDTQGVIRNHPLAKGSGGLSGVIDGLDRMRKGDVSGVKLVYQLT
jgi:aspyridone synthetase trans-acting enoyl reductase